MEPNAMGGGNQECTSKFNKELHSRQQAGKKILKGIGRNLSLNIFNTTTANGRLWNESTERSNQTLVLCKQPLLLQDTPYTARGAVILSH